jgi:hypothetical protein
MSLPADLVVAQQHEPPAGAHFVLLAGVVVTALVILGVRWWRGRDAAAAEQQSPGPERTPERKRSAEDE